ncbi:MAG: hypothetical protein LWY06_03590 [Firmicutes bacterium]|nr:hypothetical protein [Bacillota bacterium]
MDQNGRFSRITNDARYTDEDGSYGCYGIDGSIDIDDFDDENQTPAAQSGSGMPQINGRYIKPVKSVREYVSAQSREALIELMVEFAGNYPDVRSDLESRINLEAGNIARTISEVEKEINRVTKEPAYLNNWTGEGYIPDYSNLYRMLDNLFDSGHYDEIVNLGEELFREATNQLAISEDDGETAGEANRCMELIFRALMLSSMPSSQKLLRIINLLLRDTYEICSSGKIHYKQEAFSFEDWSNAATTLKNRLELMPVPAHGKPDYEREEIIDNLIAALDNAGRNREIIPIAKHEAELTGNYDRLIVEYINANMFDEAEKLIFELYEMERVSGSYSHNRFRFLLEIKELKGDRMGYAALWANEFFRHRTLASYLYMLESAHKVGLRDIIRENALNFLETGRLPWGINVPTGISQWPLPDTGLRYAINIQPEKFPYYSTLILIALEEGRYDDAVYWYDSMNRNLRKFGIFGFSYAEVLADKIKETHPDKAVEIWKKLAEEELEHPSRIRYTNAAKHLNMVKTISIRIGKEDEFDRYMEAMRQAHRKNRTFIEVLGTI